MARIYISVGSNIEAALNIRSAITALRQYYGELILSRVFESEAVGFSGDNFYNLVVGFDSNNTLPQVAAMLRQIEDEHARDRQGPRFSARTIDLDLLLYDNVVDNSNGLNVPRDEIIENAFVLQPLAEVAGSLIHPLLQQTMGELWQDFDQQRQQLWPIEFEWSGKNGPLNAP